MNDIFTTSLPKTALGFHVYNDLWFDICVVEADSLSFFPKLSFRAEGSIGGSNYSENTVYVNENELKKLWAICYAGYILFEFTRKKKINNIIINEFLITENDIEEIRAVEHLKWAVGYESKCPENFFEFCPTGNPNDLFYTIYPLFDAAFSFIAFHEIWHIINKDEILNTNKYNAERRLLDSNNKNDIKRIKELDNKSYEAIDRENQSDANAYRSLEKLFKNLHPRFRLLGLSLALLYRVTLEIILKLKNPSIDSPRLHPRGYNRLFNCLSNAISAIDDEGDNSPVYNFTAHLMRQLFPESVYQQTREHPSAKAYLNELCEVIDKMYN